MGLERDVELPAEVAYAHRTADDMEIYFIANQKNEARNFTASFRQKGLAPKLYDAVTGRTYIPEQWAEREGRTEVSLSLPAYGSRFVIFFKARMHLNSLPVIRFCMRRMWQQRIWQKISPARMERGKSHSA